MKNLKKTNMDENLDNMKKALLTARLAAEADCMFMATRAAKCTAREIGVSTDVFTQILKSVTGVVDEAVEKNFEFIASLPEQGKVSVLTGSLGVALGSKIGAVISILDEILAAHKGMIMKEEVKVIETALNNIKELAEKKMEEEEEKVTE